MSAARPSGEFQSERRAARRPAFLAPWRARALVLLALIILLLSPFSGLLAAAEGETRSAYKTTSGPKWRVIYVEGGPFHDYRSVLWGFIEGLRAKGLLAKGPPPAPAAGVDNKPLWDYLALEAKSDVLEFLPDGFYSADWDPARREEVKAQALQRIAERRDVDLVLAFGTWAGADLAGEIQGVPLMSVGATDPVNSGISLAAADSGRDNVHVHVDEGNIERQLRLFYDLFKFKRLGIPVDMAESGQDSVGLAAIMSIADELNFTVIACDGGLEKADREASFAWLIDCARELSQKSDAIYLTANNDVIHERMDEILAPIVAASLPSFSQGGSRDTQAGILMSVAEADFKDIGFFEADVAQRILEGEKPRDINQIYLPPLVLALNLKMAMSVGWTPPFEVLVAVDELYRDMAFRANPSLYRELREDDFPRE
ncbi:MAG: ABC transporter substrate-binding protein [Deltaproteobacteria bacterium]|nr:ABC transporter substrate-binding protein [Deltaproteobacteria bacterium]